MSCRLFHVVANGRTSFLWLNNTHTYELILYILYIHHNFFIHSSISGHLGCFHILAIMNNAAIYTSQHTQKLTQNGVNT